MFLDHPLLCQARRVHLAYERLEHIKLRRTSKDEAPASFVLRHLAYVVATPTHVGALTKDPRRVEIYSYVPQDISSGVCVSLKCLDGETWINTAFPVGMKALLRYVRAERLRPIHENSIDVAG